MGPQLPEQLSLPKQSQVRSGQRRMLLLEWVAGAALRSPLSQRHFRTILLAEVQGIISLHLFISLSLSLIFIFTPRQSMKKLATRGKKGSSGMEWGRQY